MPGGRWVFASHTMGCMTKVLLKTSAGDITLELDEAKAPKTVANFVDYVKAGHYANTVFHRVIPNFMIQGGGFTPEFQQKPAPQTVENEASNGLKNDKYTVAMARTSAPHSASAQFFINTSNNGFLNYPGQDGFGYAVFGKVVDGAAVVGAIEGVATGNKSGHGDVPVDLSGVTILSAELV
ncbi:peptidylprolyl isomerase [Nocardia crassostreae]|uniref:peptidylprolyl isomerase n=1 Tax=Nocardia crassostreae TaxID=53428 RepID=UPI000A4BC5BF|nr:peptidylprolyl isomerase [Nocardia crassostreae]